MASAEYNGRVYIFGGIQNNMYTNGNVTMLNTWNNDFIRSKSNIGTRVNLRKETTLFWPLILMIIVIFRIKYLILPGLACINF